MKLDLRALLAGDCRCMPVAYELTPKADSLNHFSGLTDIRFSSPVSVSGTITNTAGYMRMLLTLRVVYVASCARCLEDVPGSFSFDVERTVATPDMLADLSEDRTDEFAVVENGFLDIDELLLELLELSLPMRFLCKEDCRGLCPGCGKNLNFEKCTCKKKEIDPRMEPLRRLLEKMKAEDSKGPEAPEENKKINKCPFEGGV